MPASCAPPSRPSARLLTRPSPRQVYNSAIQACSKTGDPEGALRYVSDLRSRGLQPSIVTYNSLLDGFARTGNVTFMLRTFREMKQTAALQPDGRTYSIVINGCARAERVNSAFSVLAMMRRAGLPPNAVTYSTVINACGKANQLNRALETLAEMERDGIRPNVVTWTALIDAHGKGGRPEAALWLLSRMEASGVFPNDVTLDVIFVRARARAPRPIASGVAWRNPERAAVARVASAEAYVRVPCLRAAPRCAALPPRRPAHAGLPMPACPCQPPALTLASSPARLARPPHRARTR